MQIYKSFLCPVNTNYEFTNKIEAVQQNAVLAPGKIAEDNNVVNLALLGSEPHPNI